MGLFIFFTGCFIAFRGFSSDFVEKFFTKRLDKGKIN